MEPQVTWIIPDGGWGWFIALYSLLLHAGTTGILNAMGVMYVSWLEEFGKSRGVTSWIISIGVAVTFGFAPIPAALANRYGFRVVVFAGGIFTGAGLMVSYFATSVTFLIISIGLLAGFGCSLGYLSAVAIASVYFSKHRPIALGIGTSGAGIGALVAAPIFDYLINLYGWRATLLLTGAASLNMCVIGLLIKPMQMIDVVVEVNNDDNNCEKDSLLLQQEQEKTSIVNEERSESDFLQRSLLMLDDDHQNDSSLTIDKASISSKTPNVISLKPGLAIQGKNHEMLSSTRSMLFHNRNHFLSVGASSRPYSSLRHLDSAPKCNGNPNLRNILNGKTSVDALFARSIKHLDRISLMGSLPKEMLQSINDVENENRDNYDKHEKYLTPHIGSSDNNIKKDKGLSSFLPKPVLDFIHTNATLLKDPLFLLFACSNFLTNLAFITPVVYLVDRAVDLGLDKTLGAMLIALNGAGNVFGRVLIGALAYKFFSDRLMAYVSMMALAGVSTILSPLCGTSPVLHCIYASLIGCLLGGYATLVAVATVDLMGVAKAADSYSLLLAFMGLATLVGPPFAGLLVDWTKSYTVTYVVYGCFLVVSGVMLLPTVCKRKCRNEK